jgi:hypothetical protein
VAPGGPRNTPPQIDRTATDEAIAGSANLRLEIALKKCSYPTPLVHTTAV